MRSCDVLDEVLSVDEAAEELDIEPREVRDLLVDGVLRGKKLGGRWLVDAASVESFADELDDEDDEDSEEDGMGEGGHFALNPPADEEGDDEDRSAEEDEDEEDEDEEDEGEY